MSTNSEERANIFTMINLATIARFKRKGIPILVIYSDHHTCKPDIMGEFHKDILSLASSVICPTQKLVELAKPYTTEETRFQVIKDPWQFNSQNQFKGTLDSNFIDLIWFGSASNATYLAEILPSLIKNTKTKRNIRLNILSTSIGHQIILASLNKNLKSPRKWSINFTTWDPNKQPYQLQKLLADSDIALLPSNPRDISKAGVSHNRLVDALRGGVVPIASPMPSYLELSESSLIGSDFSEMIEYAEDRYTSLSQKFAKLREIILKDHSPQQNILNWMNTIEYHF